MTRLFNRSLWTAARLLAALPPLILLVFAIFLLRREFQHAKPEIVRLVTSQISSSTGVDIEFSSADSSVPGRLRVRDLRLSREGFGEIARASSVTVRYELTDLLRDPRNAAAHITSILIERPEVTVERRRDGTLSIVEAFRPERPRPRGRPFRGLVRVAGGRVRFIDRRPLSGAPAALDVRGEGVDGWLDFRSGRGAFWSATVRRTDVSGPVRLHGAFDLRSRMTLSVRAGRLDLPFVSRFLLPKGTPRISRGTADGSLLLTRQPSGTHFWVTGKVRQAEMELPGGLRKASGISGMVTVADTDLLTFDGTGQALGSPWSIRLSLGPLGRPEIAMTASTGRADYASALRLLAAGSLPPGLSVSGRGPVHLRAGGPAAAPAVSGEARIPEVSWRGIRARDIRGSFHLAGGTLHARAAALLEGGQAEVRLSADAAGAREGDLQAVFRGVRLTRLLEAAGYGGVQGDASGEAALRWSGRTREGRLTFEVGRPRGFGLEATSLRGSARLSGERLLVDSLLVSTPSGFASVRGSIGPDGTADLSTVVAGMPVRELLGEHAPPRTSGIVDARGTLRGRLPDLTFEGSVQAMDLRWEDVVLDGAVARLTANRGAVEIAEARLYHGTSEAVLAGRIRDPLRESRSFSLSASIRSLEIGRLASRIPALEGIEGRVSGEIGSIEGVWPELRASFEVRAEDLDIAGLSIPLASASGVYDAGRMELAEFRAQRGAATVTASGTLEETGALDFVFRLQDLDVAEALALAAQRGIPAAGQVDIEGRVEGSLSDPQVHARLTSRDLRLAARDVELDDCDLVWADGALSLKEGRARVAGGRVLLERAVISTENGSGGLAEVVARLGTDGNGEQAVDAAELLSLARAVALSLGLGGDGGAGQLLMQLPERVQGRLTGSVRVFRVNGALAAEAEVMSPDLSVWGTRLGRAGLSASTGPSGHVVHSLRLEDGDMLVTAQGFLKPDGRLEADVEGYNVDLVRLPRALEVSPAPGSADFSFTASGTLEAPEVEGSVLVTDAEAGGVKLERIATGRLLFKDGSLEVREGAIATGQNVMRFSGLVPFDIREMRLREGGRVSLEARLVNAGMDTLAALAPRLDAARSSGEVEAGVSVEGEWPAPEVRGRVRVADGQLALLGMSTVFRNVDVDIDLQGAAVAIRSFRLDSSDGGSLVLEGGGGLGPEGWTMDVSARTRGLGLKLRNVSGVYQESYTGKVDLDVRAAGPVRSPLVSGQVTARNGTLGLPVIPEEREERRKPVWNPRLALALRAGEGLRLRGPRLNVGVEGNIALSRDLEQPSVAGRLLVNSGYLLFPGSRFRVMPSGTIDFSWDSPNPPAVTLGIRAETTLSVAAGPGPGLPAYRIEALLRGPLQEPQLSFQSSPPGLETQQILNLLAQRAGVRPEGFAGGGQLEREMAQLFTGSIAPGLLQPVEEALAEAFGLDELAFGFGAPEDLNLSLSRRLFGGLSLTIWRGLGEAAEWSEWKLTYDLKGRTRLSYGESRFGDRILGLESTFRF